MIHAQSAVPFTIDMQLLIFTQVDLQCIFHYLQMLVYTLIDTQVENNEVAQITFLSGVQGVVTTALKKNNFP